MESANRKNPTTLKHLTVNKSSLKHFSAACSLNPTGFIFEGIYILYFQHNPFYLGKTNTRNWVKGGYNMKAQRAKEIIDSSKVINVTYEGDPIYIQHVNEQEDTAKVFPLDHPDKEQEVPLNALEEEE